MKRFTKFFLILAAVFVTIGLGFSVAAVAMGVSFDAFEQVMDEEMTQNFFTMLEKVGVKLETRHYFESEEDEKEWVRLVGQGELVSCQRKGDEKIYEIPAGDFDTFRLELNGVEVQFQECNSDKISITIQNDQKDKIKVYQNDTILMILEKSSVIHFGKKAIEIQIDYPKGMELEKLQMMLNAGEANLNGDLNAKKFVANLSAGEINVNGQITCGESSWKVGAGELNIQSLDCSSSVFECGVGEIQARMAGKQKEYNYEIECGIGEIRIGNDTFSGLSKKESVDNHAQSDLKVSCGVGEIDLSFS